MICEYCKKRIRKQNQNKVLLVNICQPMPEITFCRKDCKNRWSSDIQNNVVKRIVVWSVERIFDNCIFVKDTKTVSPISDKAMTMSFFSENLVSSPDSGPLTKIKMKSGELYSH